VVASFDMRGVQKENVHVSFQRNRLVVTWVLVEVSEWQEADGYLMRERNEKNFQRTLPLPEGTRVRLAFVIVRKPGLNPLLVRRDHRRDEWETSPDPLSQFEIISRGESTHLRWVVTMRSEHIYRHRTDLQWNHIRHFAWLSFRSFFRDDNYSPPRQYIGS
jgi:hypothetical protein